MLKSRAYYEAVIEYNNAMAAAARKLHDETSNRFVKKLATADRKNYEMHEHRHQGILSYLLRKEAEEAEAATGVPMTPTIPSPLDMPQHVEVQEDQENNNAE